MGTLMTLPPMVSLVLPTSGHANGAPSLPSTTSCSPARSTSRPSSVMEMSPMGVTLSGAYVNQMDAISPPPPPLPAYSAMTQRESGCVRRRHEYVPLKTSSLWLALSYDERSEERRVGN